MSNQASFDFPEPEREFKEGDLVKVVGRNKTGRILWPHVFANGVDRALVNFPAVGDKCGYDQFWDYSKLVKIGEGEVKRKFKVGDRVIHVQYPCVGTVTGFDWTHVLVKWDTDSDSPVESILEDEITLEVPCDAA